MQIPTVVCPKMPTSTGVTITSGTPEGCAYVSGVSVNVGEDEGEDEDEDEGEYEGEDEDEEENEGASHDPRERLTAGGGRARRMSSRA
jgi:hypothetical protein